MLTRACSFPRHIFPAHFVGFFFVIIVVFFYYVCSFTEMKAETVCARAQADFLRSSGPQSVNEIAKFLKKTERGVNKWSKRLKKTNQGVDSR